MDDDLYLFLASSGSMPDAERRQRIWILALRPDGLVDLTHHHLRHLFRDAPRVDHIGDSFLRIEGEYGDCLHDFLMSIIVELLKPNLGRFRKYDPARVRKNGETTTLDLYLAQDSEWFVRKLRAKKSREIPLPDQSGDGVTGLDALAEAFDPAMDDAEVDGPVTSDTTELPPPPWPLSTAVSIRQDPAAYAAVQLWPRIDWTRDPAPSLLRFCDDRSPSWRPGLDEEHHAAAAAWARICAHLEAEIGTKPGPRGRAEAHRRLAAYQVRAAFFPIKHQCAMVRLGRPPDMWKLRERYFNLLEGFKEGASATVRDRQVPRLLDLPLPDRRWIPRKGGRDYDPGRDTVEAWLKLELSDPGGGDGTPVSVS